MRQIVEFKTILNGDPIKAIKLFEKIVEGADDAQISPACDALANYIRHSSLYKRRLLFQHLVDCSLLSRLCLAVQFNKFNDTAFPKKLIFGDARDVEEEEPAQRHYTTSVGSNRCFNLGLLSDGSPVPEPRVVDLPRVIQVEMSNSHTVFLTHDRRIFGCGKSSAFLPEQVEEGGYVAEPTWIRMPNNDVIERVRVTEGGSQFLISGKWYFVGKLPHTAEMHRVSPNCHVSTAENTRNVEVLDYQETNVQFDGKSVKIYLTLTDQQLLWDRLPTFPAPKSLHYGTLRIENADNFQVLNNGTIYINKNGLMKGKLELWKNADDGFQVKSGTVMEHFDTKYSLVALLEEIPGTVGTEFFKVSPDGQNLIMKKGREPTPTQDYRLPFHWKSLQPHLIIERRAEEEHEPVDIPTDFTIIFPSEDENPERFPMNRLIFDLMFPDFSSRIRNNEIYFDGVECEIEIDWKLKRAPINEFLPSDTPPNQILHLISTEKEKIPCHKYLHLLHSRQINAFQRFQTVYSAYGPIETENEKPMEIEASASSLTVRNALRGMIDLRTLFGIKTIELIECINYYDYHMMDEMFHDAMHILIETTNEFTLPFLFLLFESFPDAIVNGLLERPDLLFHTVEQPPKELLVRFAQKYKPPKSLKPSPLDFSIYDPEYVIKCLLNLEEDSEDSIWSQLRKEMNNSLTTWHSEAMRRKEEKKPRTRSRNSSSMGQQKPETSSMTSSPIPIGGSRPKTGSFSATSPLAFSMSPMSKVLPKPRNDSICNSLEDFPEMGGSAPSPSTAKSPSYRFAPKGARFKKDTEILKTPAPVNPWKKVGGGSVEGIQEEMEVKFDDVVRKEETLQWNIRTGNKRVQLLPHVETEELAVAEISESFRQIYKDEALIRVELDADDFLVRNEQIVWGSMPGLVRR